MKFTEGEKKFFYLGILYGAAMMPVTAVRMAAALDDIWNLSSDPSVDQLQQDLLKDPDVVAARKRTVSFK